MNSDKNKYLSVKQISHYCEVDDMIVESWISRGLMGPNNKKTTVQLEDFISFLNSNHHFENTESSRDELSVLVVDDELNVASVIGEVFTSHGFKVTTSGDAIQAGLVIKNKMPKIVTLDLTMTSFDGLDVLKIINGLQLQGKIWVVVISGSSEENIQQAMNVGADCYLQKPFSNNDLEKIINKFFPNQGKNNLSRAS
jgi:CheY-like chemotaxis protein